MEALDFNGYYSPVLRPRNLSLGMGVPPPVIIFYYFLPNNLGKAQTGTLYLGPQGDLSPLEILFPYPLKLIYPVPLGPQTSLYS